MGMQLDQLSDLWQQSLKKTYAEQIAGATTDRFVGKELIARGSNGSKTNVAPEISPNGRYLIYLGQQDLFNIDPILADARSGKTIRKIRSNTVGGHVDDMNFIENSGTWSPDSKRFAYTVVAKGKTALLIADVDKGKATRQLFPDGPDAFSAPVPTPGRSAACRRSSAMCWAITDSSAGRPLRSTATASRSSTRKPASRLSLRRAYSPSLRRG